MAGAPSNSAVPPAAASASGGGIVSGLSAAFGLGGGGGGNSSGTGSPTPVSAYDALWIETIAYVARSCGESKQAGKAERLGLRIGSRVAERLSVDRPLLRDDMDAIKFVCRDVWNLLFGKTIDQLRTNRQGVYLLMDHSFKHAQCVAASSAAAADSAAAVTPPFVRLSLAAVGGAIRGALAVLGYPCSVTIEGNGSQRTFTVRLKSAAGAAAAAAPDRSLSAGAIPPQPPSAAAAAAAAASTPVMPHVADPAADLK